MKLKSSTASEITWQMSSKPKVSQQLCLDASFLSSVREPSYYIFFFFPSPQQSHLCGTSIQEHASIIWVHTLAFACLCIVNVLCIRVTVFCLVFDVFSLQYICIFPCHSIHIFCKLYHIWTYWSPSWFFIIDNDSGKERVGIFVDTYSYTYFCLYTFLLFRWSDLFV